MEKYERTDTAKGLIEGFEEEREIGEGGMKGCSVQVQKLTDGYIKRIDDSLSDKDREIRQV